MTSAGADREMRSVVFRREREAAWTELEELIARADRRGIGTLSPDDLFRLAALYRGALSSLSVARATTLDRALVEYLERLAARAYVYVYGTKRRFLPAIAAFFGRTFPALVWSMRRPVAVAAAVLVLGTLAGLVLTLRDPDLYHAFVDPEYAAGRGPLSSREELADVLVADEAEERSGLALFAGFLFTHNAGIGLACFVFGVAAGVPVGLLLFANGLLLGAFAAIHHRVGLGLELWAWLLPHGVTEILALCLCGAAGLVLGHGLVFPGRFGRLTALVRAGWRASSVVVGCAGMFLVAGLVEGFFRQLVHGVVPRLSLAAATAIFWVWYFGIHGRREAGRGEAGEGG